MKKIVFKVVGGLLLAVVLLFLGRNMIIQMGVQKAFKAATGMRLSLGAFHSDMALRSFGIKDMKLYNPSGYTEKIMLEMPELFVALIPSSLFSGKPHLTEIRLHVAKLVIERNKDGKLNLKELQPAGSKKKGESKPAQVRIDLLKLKIDKVVYKDASGTREFDLNIDETYRNIDDVRALTPIIIQNALRNQALKALANFSVGDLMQGFADSGINVADFGLDKVSGALESGVTQTASKVLGSVTEGLGSLFGSTQK